MIMIMLARQNINACDGFDRRKKRTHYPAHGLLRLFFVLCFLTVICLCPVVCLAEEGDEGAFEETVSIVDPISREEGYSAILYSQRPRPTISPRRAMDLSGSEATAASSGTMA